MGSPKAVPKPIDFDQVLAAQDNSADSEAPGARSRLQQANRHDGRVAAVLRRRQQAEMNHQRLQPLQLLQLIQVNQLPQFFHAAVEFAFVLSAGVDLKYLK